MRQVRGATRRLGETVLAAASAALLLAACSSSGGSPDASQASADTGSPAAVTVDLGDGKSVTIAKPLKIAFFSVGTSNTYLNAVIAGAQAKADEVGATMDVFDAAFDPTEQSNQIQTAIQSGKYNAFVFQPVSGPASCTAISEDAPAAGILVSVNIAVACNRGPNVGDDLWQPGTLNYVGGTTSVTAYTAWAEEIQRTNPGPQKVAFVVGPDLNVPVENAKLAMNAVAEAHPEFELVGIYATDYTSADGLAKTQNALQANPDVTIVATNYSELTKGAIAALESAGKQGQVKLYDYGADPFVLDGIKNGVVTMTAPYYPYSAGQVSVQALQDAADGKTPIRVILNDGAPKSPLQGDAPILIITKENVADFKSEY